MWKIRLQQNFHINFASLVVSFVSFIFVSQILFSRSVTNSFHLYLFRRFYFQEVWRIRENLDVKRSGGRLEEIEMSQVTTPFRVVAKAIWRIPCATHGVHILLHYTRPPLRYLLILRDRGGSCSSTLSSLTSYFKYLQSIPTTVYGGVVDSSSSTFCVCVWVCVPSLEFPQPDSVLFSYRLIIRSSPSSRYLRPLAADFIWIDESRNSASPRIILADAFRELTLSPRVSSAPLIPRWCSNFDATNVYVLHTCEGSDTIPQVTLSYGWSRKQFFFWEFFRILRNPVESGFSSVIKGTMRLKITYLSAC